MGALLKRHSEGAEFMVVNPKSKSRSPDIPGALLGLLAWVDTGPAWMDKDMPAHSHECRLQPEPLPYGLLRSALRSLLSSSTDVVERHSRQEPAAEPAYLVTALTFV